MLPPQGRLVSTHCFVDASLANDQCIRRSQTGILIFVNRAPVPWYSKRQNKVDTSTFGPETVAMENAIKLIEGLRYKLRMMGVEIDESTNTIAMTRQPVTKHCSIPESTHLRKSITWLLTTGIEKLWRRGNVGSQRKTPQLHW